MTALLILGAGGQGRVVADTARLLGRWTELVFLDDGFPEGATVDGLPVLGGLSAAAGLRGRFSEAVVAVGDNHARLRLFHVVREAGFTLPALVHPSAVVSDRAVVGAGTVVFAQCVVNPGAVVGEACIINTAATIDHDCAIGAGVHISPGAHLGGTVTVGDRTWLGVGASVKHGITIGSDVIVGVGAAVVSDLPDGVTAVGVPARIVSGPEDTA